MRIRLLWRITIAGCLGLALAVGGCSRPKPTYVDEGRSYDRKSALTLFDVVDAPDLSAVPVEEGSERRHEALASLRSQGDAPAEAARLITEVFPPETSAVPYYIENADYEGEPAVVILEAIGPPGGKLTEKRVWVISETGDVLITGTR